VVVEVKALARKTQVHQPLQHLTGTKLRKLILLASIIAARYPAQSVRIDAITVHWQSGTPVIEHIPNISQ
jgi:Holliday junction resolvase-like predicted endonuclease